jgi:alpha-ketoglutaric semialdehyde dehydrogenase
VVLPDGVEADAFAQTAAEALADVEAQVMLNDGVAAGYAAGVEKLSNSNALAEVMRGPEAPARCGSPAVYQTTAEAWMGDASLADEVFGPAGILVRVRDEDERLRLAEALEGQLTATLQMDEGDMDAARALMPVLERKAGRILANGFPTGVEVADAMVHGGPYPASTNFGATSVGTLAIRRFLRPVCFQNIDPALLPDDLK